MNAGQQAYAALRICYFNGLIPLWRSPILIAAIFLTPFSFLFFLFVLASPAVLPFGVAGGILFTSIFTGNGMLNDCAYLRLERNLQSVFVASPIRPLTYILGMALSELAFAIPAILLFFLILARVHPFGAATLAALLAIIGLTWLMATTLGFLLSTLFKQLREIWPIATLIFSTLAILPPVFYPISVIPAAYQWVPFLAPSTFASQLADRALGLSYGTGVHPGWLGSPAVDLAGLLGTTMLFGLLTLALARWRER